MKHIRDLILSKTQEHSAEMMILAEMLAVDWENLPVDTVVEAATSVGSLAEGKGCMRHFKGVDRGQLLAFADGGSSATTKSTAPHNFMRLVCNK